MPRRAVVATVCQGGNLKPTGEANVAHVLGLLDSLWPHRPDIICLPENFDSAGVAGSAHDRAHELPGPVVERVSVLARKHSCWIVCPQLTLEGDVVYNTAILLDRAGEIAGIYRKRHPVTNQWDYGDMEGGVTPGSDVPVFETDLGRIGIQICFDIEYPESWAELGRLGADLVFWPSAYDGGFPLRAYAYLHGYYVVSSVRTTHSRIINPLGEELHRTGPRLSYAVDSLNLEYIVCHTDFHTGMVEELARVEGGDLQQARQHARPQFFRLAVLGV